MPTVIAIEAKPVEFEGIDTGFLHLYLVKTVTDEQGRVISEKVIRGTAGSNGDLETLADANLATSPDRRGSDTPEERHREVLDLGTRNANDVWKIMVQHANNIEAADLDYSIDIIREAPGGDLNSNSVVASVLHSAGLDLTKSFPDGVSRSDAPLYGQLQYMYVDDILYGTGNNDRIMGGIGNDRLYGRNGNDRLSGEDGNDRINAGNGNDTLFGGDKSDYVGGATGHDALYGGTGHDLLFGSSGKDRLSGGSGNDRLYGGSEQDNLIGGSGQDAFVFYTAPNGTTDVDVVRDFSVADDTIWLQNSVFKEVGSAGRLKSALFRTGDEARDSTDRIIYDRDDGFLYYDADGTGAIEQVAFAKLSVGLRITSLDFQII
ncbi:Ca2+-binding RTX toxin-like protein [Microvirga lupini]|uniref:Ca2+-binding RTX toxin-like protein n=1 Tax=Microvirga lupini TaxID=420324 RepID=A0A7W4VLY4_9HYPH|nr:calcium-binding protein [Microvirga lupini]MBB3019556.1 Ca2+-binding RTX toxin-like protein [Microvirga lupini]